MKTLYEIEGDYLALVSQIEASDGEITEEMSKALTLNEKTLKQKSEHYLEFIGSREKLCERIDDEIKRLQAIKKSESKWIDKLKDKLVNAVILFGDIKLGLKTITTRPSQIVDVDMDKLHKDFKVTKVTFQADKTKIKEALKDGQKVKGAKLVDKFNFRLK